MTEDPELLRASEHAFAVLRRGAEAACATATANRPPALMVALHIWSLSHGIASLFIGRSERARAQAADVAGGPAGGRAADLPAVARAEPAVTRCVIGGRSGPS